MSHPKFGLAWQDWTQRIQECIINSAHDYDYIHTFDCVAFITPANVDHTKFIKNKIARAVEICESTYLSTQYLCFDSAYFPYEATVDAVRVIQERRRKTNYEAYVSTAFQLSNALQTNEIYLLDYPIPSLTVIAVSYLGIKQYI